MQAIQENIQALSRAVLSEAQAEAERGLADARAKADAIRQRAQEQAGAERVETLERARLEAERIRSQAVATAQLQAHMLLLERREKLLDSVFDAARQQLPAIQERPDYEQIAHRLAREAVSQLGVNAASIQADERTIALLTDSVLAGISQETGTQVQRGPVLEGGTGVVAYTADEHRQCNNTLEIRLSRGQETLRAPVYRLLKGESL
jgi:vacuolar-type H+-ATPase subunit E/Vma4